ncbi:glycosyltransferase [Pontibacter sp. MBLB2868]|uniref:glycosyltransferase n=1 Tax=Pontibacter sp. MBLB2868 TaxID=3451555 RepID=UPI003F75483F
MKTTVLHVIETLDRGGAEKFFVNYINALPNHYINIVVILREPYILSKELTNVSEIFYLEFKGKSNILSVAFKLNKITKKCKVNIIHSHLFWPTLVARIAKPYNVYLISSVHNLISKDAFEPNILSKIAEILTAHLTNYFIFVSNEVRLDYIKHIKVSKPSSVLYNFLDNEFYAKNYKIHTNLTKEFKLVTVGNLRYQKNHSFLINCLQKLKSQNINLDIYGSGIEYEQLLKKIFNQNITNVELKGSTANIYEVIGEYDAFVLSSRYEGFCLSMVEAMKMGLPCVVPDLRVLKEVSGNTQVYFSQQNEDDFIEKILKIKNDHKLRNTLAENGKIMASTYQPKKHLQKLIKIYQKACS